ncbi:endonuclease domain-containing protein [Marilutibacter chinensis]|uniref:Endonuclease domain-containing protein n=1 Tax=Marilutibacter chinensis TaxID=2912247 RepID=A0ABS9HUZ7_9GAMM|nr:endonuclease domain-containing protein [Lysobacter chinensis]MCF7222034.1 endonuclease domain-containing protein [Lysobacter chinensis]
MRQGEKRDFARQLRRAMTDAERRLWCHLRNRVLMGWKFRRQHPIGPYITDFACIEAELVVELDGGQHAEDPRDAIRDAFLQAEGYRVLRFWNNDALERTEVVLEVILAALVSAGPHPSLSSADGRAA